GSTWSLSPAKDGVSVDPTNGVITVAHNAASAGTQVSATAKHGNSDASTAASVALPGKAATPAAPTVASDEANARVTVTPSADADRVEVTVGDATVVATKTGSTWSLSPAKDGVSVDPTSGVITVAHNAASAGTQVSATAKHGNSDASTAASVALPGKAAIRGVHNNGDLESLKTAAKALPNTGTVKSTLAIPVAITSALLSLGLVGGRRRKEDEEV
ncbi:LPXTG cell wall anchor domain-containing protein, partial [Streptococcus mitis]|uniref:LPXTG cell wall anchor domain-containing protein n=1 Tax=Streptococcus mitis TaxID=28037 RepID=UPI0039C0C415